MEFLAALAALAAALVVRPWRLLAKDSRYVLLPPLLAMGTALPLLWWWTPDTAAPVMSLMGAQLVLLTLGWPLAVLLFGYAGLAGVIAADASAAEALHAFVWSGVVPATFGMSAGHLMRMWTNTRPLNYLIGRAFIIALLATFAAALLAQSLFGHLDRFGTAATPALFLISLLDATLTGGCMTILVVHYPRAVATWSHRLYVATEPLKSAHGAYGTHARVSTRDAGRPS